MMKTLSDETLKFCQLRTVAKLEDLASFIEGFNSPELGNLLVALQWHAKRFHEGEFDEVVRQRYTKELNANAG